MPCSLHQAQRCSGAVTRCSSSPLQSTALGALPVAQLMMHIQRPLPVSSSGDFSAIYELQCIQLNKEHVLFTAEISLYQGLSCLAWRGKAGWTPVSFPVSVTSTCRTFCGTTYSMAVPHAFPDLLLPMSGPSSGDIVGYCCSGKSVSLGITSNTEFACSLASFPK